MGTILIEYDNDKLIPTYGFGAEIDGEVSHAFPLSRNGNTADLEGVEGVLSEYTRFLESGVRMSGPTYFSRLIEQCMTRA